MIMPQPRWQTTFATQNSSSQVIPEGAGPCQASDLGLFVAVCRVPGTGAGQALVRGRGQGSTEGRPRRGLALMPAPRWRSVFVPGVVSWGWGWPRAPTSDVDGWQLSERVWLPVIPSPPALG